MIPTTTTTHNRSNNQQPTSGYHPGFLSDFMGYKDEEHFRLEDSFLRTYKDKRPNFGYNGLGEFVFYRTYSRLKDNGNKETFLDCITRVIEGTYEIQRRHCRRIHIPWDYDKALVSAYEMFQHMWDFKFLPPGRGLWCMGTNFMWERGSAALNNCFRGDTEIITRDGIKPIGELVDTVQDLLTIGGKWVEAPIKPFGKQPIYRLVVEKAGVRKIINTTADHVWYVKSTDGDSLFQLKHFYGHGTYTALFTRHLQAGRELITQELLEPTPIDLVDDSCRVSAANSDARAIMAVAADVAVIANDQLRWSVVSVDSTDEIAEVFCPQVPNTHVFTLAGNILTGNCGFVSTEDIATDPAEPFCFLMDMSMLGVGIGFDTLGKGAVTVSKPNCLHRTTYQVPDSREGWVQSVRLLIGSYTTNPEFGYVDYDYSLVRPAGIPIKGFGGVASGPDNLARLHEMMRSFFESRVNKCLGSVDIVDVMNMIGVCVVAGNVRRCLPTGTLIHLKRGLVPIENVQVGDLVLTSRGYKPVSENIDQGSQKVLTIRTKMGPFRCTARHRVAILKNFTEYGWKRADKLQPGDRMVFVDDMLKGTDTVLPAYTNQSSRGTQLVIPGLTTEIAWFLGAVHGDGYVHPGRVYRGRRHHGASVMIPVNRDEYYSGTLAKIYEGFSAFGFDRPGDQPSQDNCRKIRVISRNLAAYFYRNFKQAKTPLDIPECIRLGRVNIRCAYLAGLLDSDGSVKNSTRVLDSVYYDFVRQVQAVYASLGIPTKFRKGCDETEKNKTKWRLSLSGDFAVFKFRELVQPYVVKQVPEHRHPSGYDFGYPTGMVIDSGIKYHSAWTKQSKQMTVMCARRCGVDTANLVPVEVFEVVDEGITCETRDLSIPDGNEFVAQGMLVHNSSEISFGDIDDVAYTSMKNPICGLEGQEIDTFYNITNRFYAAKKHEITAEDFIHMYHAAVGEETQRNGHAKTLVTIREDKLNPAIATWNAFNQHRWASNNSIAARVGMDYSNPAAQTAINGEPGYAWVNNMRDYGRMIDGKRPGIDGRVKGTNPCFAGDMRLLTANGYRTMEELWVNGGCQEYDGPATIAKYGSLRIFNKRGEVVATNVYRTGRNSDLFRVSFSNGAHLDVTDTHEFITLDTTGREVRKPMNLLQIGDHIPVHGSNNTTDSAGSYTKVTLTKHIGKGDTFCLTEPGDHAVIVEGCHVGQCGEQSLESYELCCLVESFPAHHEGPDDYQRTLKFAYLYAKTVTLLPTHNARTNSVTLRNRRIGVSQSGIVQAFVKFGRRIMLRDFCDAGYHEIRRWDNIYSDWLCVGKSIKVTSIKPSGTVSLVSGSTPGIHYPEARSYWRRVRIGSNSPLIQIVKDAGYYVEPAYNDPNTSIIKFAVDESRVPAVTEIPMWQQVANVVDYQHYWADNQPSCTVKFKRSEASQIASLLEINEDKLKCISFLPLDDHGYKQAPYEACTVEEVHEYNSKLKPIDFSLYLNEDALGSKFCDGDQCTIL